MHKHYVEAAKILLGSLELSSLPLEARGPRRKSPETCLAAWAAARPRGSVVSNPLKSLSHPQPSRLSRPSSESPSLAESEESDSNDESDFERYVARLEQTSSEASRMCEIFQKCQVPFLASYLAASSNVS